MADKPHIFAADICKNPHSFDIIPDKPLLLAAENCRKPQTLEIIPDKPHLFAADICKKTQALDIIPDNIRKRRSISVKEKLDILNMVDSGCKLSAVARQFGISSSTASTIVKERHKIKLLSDHYNIDPDRKRMRLGIYRDVDEAVHIWFRQMRMKNIPINGPMLQQKAREFAQSLGHQNFEGSSGWLFRFRERHGLSVKTMRDNDDNNSCCSAVGMTDDEIVTSVSQNAVHLNFADKQILKQEIPENYLVPEIEFSEPASKPSDNVSATEFNDCGPICEYNNSDNTVDYNNSTPAIEYNDTGHTVEYNMSGHSVEYNGSVPAMEYSSEHSAAFNSNKPVIEFKSEHSIAYDGSRPTIEYRSEHSAAYDRSRPAFEYKSERSVAYDSNIPDNYNDGTITHDASSLTLQNAVSIAQRLTTFLKHHNVPLDIWKSMNTVNNFIKNDLREQLKQKKITDYFKP